MSMKEGRIVQHIEIREVDGVPAVVTVSSPAPEVTNVTQVKCAMSESRKAHYREMGHQDAGYAPELKVRKRSVLVVDDDEEALEEMVDTLRDYDLVVLPAKDAEEALSLADQHKPAYVVMDFNLPKMNGLDAITAMKQILPDTTYIMISGCPGFCRVATVKNTKTYAVLQKPISMNGIARFITTTIATSKGKPADIRTMVQE